MCVKSVYHCSSGSKIPPTNLNKYMIQYTQVGKVFMVNKSFKNSVKTMGQGKL